MSADNLIDIASDKLKDLAKLVSRKDRQECEKATGFAQSTISDYLKGIIRDLHTANTIYVFLKKRSEKNLKPFLKEN